jgi:hypothetical protein
MMSIATRDRLFNTTRTVQARTMEIYAKLGIVHRALELGKPGTGANLWTEGRKMGRVPLGDAGQRSVRIHTS